MSTALDKETLHIISRPVTKRPAPTLDVKKPEKPLLPPKPGLALTKAPECTNSNFLIELPTNQSTASTPVTPPLLSPSSEPIICLAASLSSQSIAPPTADSSPTQEASPAALCSPSPVSPIRPVVFFPQAPPSPQHAPPTLFPSPPSTPSGSDPPSPVGPQAPRGLQELSEAV